MSIVSPHTITINQTKVVLAGESMTSNKVPDFKLFVGLGG